MKGGGGGGLTCTPGDGESRAVGSKAKEPSVGDGGGGVCIFSGTTRRENRDK